MSAFFDTADLDQVRALAATETEGETSMMLRKLIREALAARAGQHPRCHDTDPAGGAA